MQQNIWELFLHHPLYSKRNICLPSYQAHHDQDYHRRSCSAPKGSRPSVQVHTNQECELVEKAPNVQGGTLPAHHQEDAQACASFAGALQAQPNANINYFH